MVLTLFPGQRQYGDRLQCRPEHKQLIAPPSESRHVGLTPTVQFSVDTYTTMVVPAEAANRATIRFSVNKMLIKLTTRIATACRDKLHQIHFCGRCRPSHKTSLLRLCCAPRPLRPSPLPCLCRCSAFMSKVQMKIIEIVY